MLAQTLALEWAPDGIRVNVVSPGMTQTRMIAKLYEDPKSRKPGKTSDRWHGSENQ